MAAVDRRMPDLDDFVGLNWSCWFDRVDIKPPDAQSEDTKSGRDCCETMTLRKEDMPIYGHCPSQDEFYLVVCSHCGKLVKPQAFEEHCNRRHNSLTKTSVSSFTTLLQQPRACRPSSNVLKETQRDSRIKEPSAPLFSSQRRPSKVQKEEVSLPTEDKVTLDKLHPALPQRPRIPPPPPVASPLPDHCRPSSFSPGPSFSASSGPSPVKLPVQKPTAAQTSNSPQRETRTYSRIQKNTKASITNKKCENQDKKKLSAQEAIQTQRGKTESDLPIGASSPRDSEPFPAKATGSQGAPKETRCTKFTQNTYSHIVRSKHVFENFPEEESSVEVQVQPPYPFNQSLLLSDDSDNEEQCNNLSTTSWHPRPLGLCNFGCRTFGCSVFTFDRRLHRLRIALSAMLDNHVNSQLWKKMPHPASTLRSTYATPSARGSPVRPGTGPNQTSSYSVKPTSLERLKTPKNNCKKTKSPPTVTTLSTAPGQQSTSFGQTNKAHMGQKELMQHTKTTHKSTLFSHSTSSKHIAPSNVHVLASLSKKTPPLSPLCPSERNTPVLNESLPPKPSPPCSKGRTPRITQPRAGGCDDRTLVQKRKAQSTPTSSSSSPSKKCPRLSPPSRSSMFSWKRDSSQDVWLGVWRKDHASEDDSTGQY